MEKPETLQVAEATPSPCEIPWGEIEVDLQAGMSMREAEKKYNVKYDTIKKHVKRHKIVVPSQQLQRTVQQQLNKAVGIAVEKAIDKWVQRGETHREVAFEKAHESIKLFKPKAPKSFRELEAADKVARRAAGLEVADTVQATLINVNEAIDSYADQPQEAEIIEGETPPEPATLESPALSELQSS